MRFPALRVAFYSTLLLTMGCAPQEPEDLEATAEPMLTPAPALAEHPLSQPLTDLIVGDSGQTPQESLHALMDAGMAAYAVGQQRAFEQWAGIEPQPLPAGKATEATPIVPDSLQQMADKLVLQYKESIGVDPNTKVTEPQLPPPSAQ